MPAVEAQYPTLYDYDVFCMLLKVYLWSSEYKKVTSKYSIIVILLADQQPVGR